MLDLIQFCVLVMCEHSCMSAGLQIAAECFRRFVQSRVIHVGEHYVVVSKPPGIPVVPCVCNILESCLACTAQARSQGTCISQAACCPALAVIQNFGSDDSQTGL